MAAFLVNDANENIFALNRSQVGDNRPEGLALSAGGLEKDFLVVRPDKFHTGFVAGTTPNAETRVRLGDFEGDRGQRALGLVARNFESSDPVIALVVAAHIGATGGDGIALDGLARECLAGCDPVFKRAVLKIQIHRAAIFSGG